MIAFRMITLIGVFVFGLAIVLSGEVTAAPFTRLPMSVLPEQIGEKFDVVEVRRGNRSRNVRRGNRSRNVSRGNRSRNINRHIRSGNVSRYNRSRNINRHIRSGNASRYQQPRHYRPRSEQRVGKNVYKRRAGKRTGDNYRYKNSRKGKPYAGKKHRYDRRRHGKRYKHRNGRYRYHYGDYWYAYPFWNFPVAIYYNDYYDSYAQQDAENNAHIDWCLNKYRSYDPRTDTYWGYDGIQHRCNSPYVN